ncbi:1-phosphatidylinositol-3-phosphate 5-kinase, partial [Tulasnella sp. 427]
VVFYDNEFDRLEKTYFSFRNFLTSEKELKKLTGANLKRMYEFINGGTASGVSEVEGKAPYPTPQVPAPPSSASENESVTDAEKASEPSQSEAEKLPSMDAPAPSSPLAPEEVADAESDSTIGASRSQEVVPTVPVDLPKEETMEKLIEEQEEIPVEAAASKLPRRAKPQSSVADLVKQFQSSSYKNQLPISMGPGSGLVSESDQEIEVPVRRRTKSKGPTAALPSKIGSDVERKTFTKAGFRQTVQTRRQMSQMSAASRIPVPIPSSYGGESSHNEAPAFRAPSRSRHVATSPPKFERVGRGPLAISEELERKGPHLPKHMTSKSHTRHSSRDRSSSRASTAPPPPTSKGNARRIAPGKGANVTTLARQFERLSRDNEKANRRYAIMKGRRARPVASSKAKVEVFDNMLDAARDDSEDGSEASSEADDEYEGDELGKRKGSPDQQSLTDSTKEETQQGPEPEPLKIPEPLMTGSARADDYFDLTSPTVARPPPLEPEGRQPLATTNGAEIITSRPASPMPDISPTTQISSSYQSNHSESEYSVGGGGERQSVINTMFGYSGFSWMREATPSFVHLKYPALPSEHLFEEAPIAVREDEPTSIIAFTLQSPGYLAALTKTKATVKVSDRPEAFMPDNDGSVSDSQSWGIISLDGLSDAVNEIKEPPTITHPVFHFESGGVQISCTVFHAEQFDALRRSCFCDQSMIESLARCVKWDASGGKSGSAFLKTRDNRFIAKEISRSELDAMSKFAPKYFQYMSDAISAKRPTLLAKIFGFYKIVYKNPVLGKTVRMTLLVMENLFYDHKSCQVYDLKGSFRNRLAPITSSNPNQVLLDENLVNNLHLAPMYIREHSKRILRSALYSDSLFLEDLNVMDYSLLVAVDDNKKEIIVGMIDYIRTYTWDKKLESWVKESTFLGGAGKGEPTIVTPKQYRTRFLNAMERYFFLVPDRWMKTTYTPEEEAVKDDW